jgi:hypothetical protein
MQDETTHDSKNVDLGVLIYLTRKLHLVIEITRSGQVKTTRQNKKTNQKGPLGLGLWLGLGLGLRFKVRVRIRVRVRVRCRFRVWFRL